MAGDCGTVVDLVEERALEGDGDEKIESRVSKRRCVGAVEPRSSRRPAEINVSATLMRARLREGAGQDDESTFLHLLSTPFALPDICPLEPALRD